jgi:hypothetical protein
MHIGGEGIEKLLINMMLKIELKRKRKRSKINMH